MAKIYEKMRIERTPRQELVREEKPKETQHCLCSVPNKTDWKNYHLARTNEKRLFYQLLYELCQLFQEPQTIETPTGRPKASLSDLLFSLGLKLYTKQCGRVLHSDLKMAEGLGFIEKTPGVNTLNDFMNCEATEDLLLKMLSLSAMPLKNLETDFAMDSSGFGSYQYERWQRVRFKKGVDGKELKKLCRNYLKSHIIIGVKTNVILTSEITPGNYADAKQAPKLLEALKDNFNPQRVSADKAYSSTRIHQIIQSLGAIPYIPFKKNANPNKRSPEIWIKAFDYFKNHSQEFMYHYHKRSNVETTFSMVKLKFGEFLKCKKFESQRNELLMKFICHNICCLVTEIFERKINIDFKKCMEALVNRKVESQYNGANPSNYEILPS